MIRFIKDYTTKALPPEHFEEGQEVTDRSAESELYFVRLGVAGYLIDGKLVDQDYQPIVTQTVLVVEAGDRRFGTAGRAGELLGLDAPQRASSGPGNAAVFGDAGDGTLSQVEFDQLRGDLAASASQFDEYRTTSDSEIERLKGLLEASDVAFRDANATHVAEIEGLTSERDAARQEASDANGRAAEAERVAADAQTRITALEAQLDDATKPPEADTSPARSAKAK